MNQWSILTLQLSALVMDVVFSGERRGIPHELYTDDLVLMAPIMEPLGTCAAEHRGNILAGKSKIMVVSSDGTMTLNARQMPCDVCGKGVQTLLST